MSYKNPISREDPNAIEKLNLKLDECERLQDKMKEVNAYYRKYGKIEGCPALTTEEGLRLAEDMRRRYPIYTQPYPQYALTNNNAEIRRLKKRIEEIAHDKEVGFVGWQFEGGEAVANDELCRLQLVFDEKPTEEQIYLLKLNGFKWSPNNRAWQRQLNQSAIYAADRLGFVNPVEGGRASALQPKIEVKDKDKDKGGEAR